MKAPLPVRPLPYQLSGVTSVEAAIGLIAVLVVCCGVLDFSAFTWSRHQLASVADDGARRASVTEDYLQSWLQEQLNGELGALPFLSGTNITISDSQSLPSSSEEGRLVTAQGWHPFFFIRLIGFPGVMLSESAIYRSESNADRP